MERYRSGHNEADSKSVVQQCTVGSNPTRSAKKDYTFSVWSFYLCIFLMV